MEICPQEAKTFESDLSYVKSMLQKKENVVVTGMPRVDCLFDDNYLKVSKNKLLAKYPMLKDKKIILYAPTFRGNIYQGFFQCFHLMVKS